jgi:hypothetical protein
MARKPAVHTVKDPDGGWINRTEGSERGFGRALTKSEAEGSDGNRPSVEESSKSVIGAMGHLASAEATATIRFRRRGDRGSRARSDADSIWRPTWAVYEFSAMRSLIVQCLIAIIGGPMNEKREIRDLSRGCGDLRTAWTSLSAC